MGYHINKIKKGVLGEFSKIQEEFEELSDAVQQEDKILQLCELSDLIGAIECFVESKLFMSLDDLIRFSNKTKSAFKENKR
jgi:NTP pyrophosphatase (non-canonical NTP hydrolase)